MEFFCVLHFKHSFWDNNHYLFSDLFKGTFKDKYIEPFTASLRDLNAYSEKVNKGKATKEDKDLMPESTKKFILYKGALLSELRKFTIESI